MFFQDTKRDQIKAQPSDGQPKQSWWGVEIIETILRRRQDFFEEIYAGQNIAAKVRSLLITSFIFMALYGAVLGSTSSLWQTLSSAMKLPVLFLATLLICAPTLYFFNLIYGSNQSLSQNIALMLTAICITAVILVSCAPIVVFFLLTSADYQFFKLLNVAIFSLAGIYGASFLNQGMRYFWQKDNPFMPAPHPQAGPYPPAKPKKPRSQIWLMRIWLLVYAFVGSQMAWTLRPFIGAPSMEFELFRQLGGNFYSDIFASIGEILGYLVVR
jgi:hypothetical protein